MEFKIQVLLPLTLGFVMFALGLGLTGADFARVVRQPRAFLLGWAAQMVLLPAGAYIVAIAFGLSPGLAAGFMIIALCPGGVQSNVMTKMARGDVALSVSLTAIVSVIAVATLPVLSAFFVRHFLKTDAPEIDVTFLSMQMLAMALVPMLAGMAVRRTFRHAEALEKWCLAVAMIVFLGMLGLIIYENRALLLAGLPTLGPSTITLMATLMLAGLLLARAAGLSQPQSTTIGLETGVQNGVMGVTVGALIGGSGVGSEFVLPAALYGVLTYVVPMPFIVWRFVQATRNMAAGA